VSSVYYSPWPYSRVTIEHAFYTLPAALLVRYT
jgi:hypothetical protein